MSQQELHDLLVKLEHQRKQLDPISVEQNHRLDDLIASLEQQKLYPDEFDQYSTLVTEISDFLIEYENQHPALAVVLKSISQLLNNFRT